MVFLGCNEEQAHSVGLSSSDDIIGKTIYDFQDKNVAEMIIKNNKEVMKFKKTMEFEELHKFPTGNEIFFSTKTPLFDKKENVIGIVGFSYNISQQKKENEIKERLFLSIISHMPCHVYWKDAEGYYLGCNDLQAQNLGFKYGSEVIGKKDNELSWSKKTAENFRENDLKVIITGNTVITQEELTINKSKKIMLSHKVPLKDSQGNMLGILGISTDVTELKNTQQELAEQLKMTQLERQKSIEFVSVAAHEIRGPIGNIINILNRINKKNEKTNFTINDALEQANKSIYSIDFLLKLLELDRYGLIKKSSVWQIEDFLNFIISKYDNINHKKMLFKKDIDSLLSFQKVEFDTDHIQEIFQILINNAIKYSPEKTSIILKAEFKNDSLLFSVKDEGIGISKQYLENILQPVISNKINTKKQDRYHKPSIKLSYAQKILQYLEGNLWIESTPKKGTEVFLNIPINSANRDFKKNKKKAPEKIFAINQIKTLLIEDDPLTAELQKHILQKLVKKIDIASTGLEAINLIQKNNYHIYFVDITLPDINGIKIMQKIREKHGNNMIIIALTSHATGEDIDLFMEKGFTAVLTKPLNENDFKNYLETAVKIWTENPD